MMKKNKLLIILLFLSLFVMSQQKTKIQLTYSVAELYSDTIHVQP
jgi:hypothetical protein